MAVRSDAGLSVPGSPLGPSPTSGGRYAMTVEALKHRCVVSGLALLASAGSCLIACGCLAGGGDERPYTIDEVVAAGWTKSKQLPAETLPQVSEVWYGFSDRKDVEVRVYPSKEDALEHGVGPAQEAVDRWERSFGANRALLRLQYGHEGKWTTGELSDLAATLRTRYAAYLLAGNLVLLCETDVGACESLAGRMALSRQ